VPKGAFLFEKFVKNSLQSLQKSYIIKQKGDKYEKLF